MRIFFLIVNGLGIGGDTNPNHPPVNTFRDVNKKIKMQVPNLRSMGLYTVSGQPLYTKSQNLFIYGRLKKENNGKNMVFDYLEFFGNAHKKPLLNLAGGLPQSILKKFEKKTKLQFIGNVHTEHLKAIEFFGQEHVKTGRPILYFSSDNSLQVAANIHILTKERLYQICQIMAKHLKVWYGIDKVVARPFGGSPDAFYRIHEKKQFIFQPKQRLPINQLAKKTKVILLSNLSEIFQNIKGCSRVLSATDDETMHQLNKIFNMKFSGVVFAGLTDLYKYAKQRDVVAYANQLERIDAFVGQAMQVLQDDDILFVVGNHPCSPISRTNGEEYVPILSYKKNKSKSVNLKTVEYSYIINGLLNYCQVKNYPENLFSKHLDS